MFTLLFHIYLQSKKMAFLLLTLMFRASVCFSQGLVNNGAEIVLSGTVQMYIDGIDGNYTSQSSGSVTTASLSVIFLEGNWINNSPNVGFTIDGGEVVLTGNTQTITGTNATAFYNLSLAGNGVKTLAINSTTVGGQANFTGTLSVGTSTLDLNSNRIDITNSSTTAITRSSGYIVSETPLSVNPGIIRWYHRTSGGTRIYPFGVDGAYIPFTLNITASMTNTAGYVDVSTRSTPSDNTPWAGPGDVAAVSHMYSPNNLYSDGSIPAVIDRWWNIENSDPLTADLTFSYRGSENTLDPLYSGGFLGAQYWDGSGWMPDNATIGTSAAVTSGVGTVSAPGISKFCPWVLSALLSPLPVELLNFEARCVQNTIAFEWCTASETNNSFFFLEQSADNITYQTIANIYPHSNQNEPRCYNHLTSSSSSPLNYFRLSQTDQNKNTKLLKIISLESCHDITNQMILTNNGSRNIGLILHADWQQHLQLQVHNTLGQLVEIKELDAVKGDNFISIVLTNVSNEIYYVSIYDADEKRISKKIVITDLN
jgi:hypothetical protein